MIPAPRWTRTDSDLSETIALVRITDGAEYPYLVQITNGPDDDFVGLYNLDGDQIDTGNCSWKIVTEAPAEVVDQIDRGWESGTSTVTRI